MADANGRFLRLADALARVEQPLESVVGLAEMLCDRSRDMSAAARDEMIEHVAIRAQTAQHALRNVVVAEQLAIGALEPGSEVIQLRELVESVAQEWMIADHGARVSVTGSVDAIGDAGWTARILRNLSEDAVGRGARAIEVRITDSHRKVVVEIEDDGIEVPEDDRNALASPYRRHDVVQWNGSTLGLGVVVARGLARSMGGEVRLFRAGDRNVFELTLPRPSQGVSARGQLPRVSLATAQGKPRWDDLVEVLDADAISMVYQAIVDIRTEAEQSKAVGYESLARFPYASPPEWFKLAGSSGRGPDLELLALRAGIDAFATHDEGSFLALNLSNATLLSPGLSAAIEAIEPGRLVLELSDTARIRSYGITRKAVDSLRERGVRLAVDDVGAGQLDIWHLLRLDPEIIKLDRNLVADPENVKRNNALIKGITAMARDLGIMVIAEAIETDAERRRLLDLGVEFGQGYLFGKPEPLVWNYRVLSDVVD